jgi:multisubunit Na+/H+ antiporter MnhC subunit
MGDIYKMGIFNGAKEQMKWGNLKYLGGYPGKTISFICGLYNENDYICVKGGATWQQQFTISKDSILGVQVRENKILMRINYDNTELEIQFTAPQLQIAYNKITTVIHQSTPPIQANIQPQQQQPNIDTSQKPILEKRPESITPEKFYKKNWFMWLTCFFFAPVGLYLLWKNKKSSKIVKIVLSVIFAFIFIIEIGVYAGEGDEANITSSTNANVEQSSTPKPKPVVKKLTPAELKKKAADDKKKAAAAKLAAQKKAKADAIKAKKEAYQNWVNSQFSAWDGSHTALKELVKENMNDPDSFDHVETTYADKKTYLLVRMKYRGTNAFGGVVTNVVIAKSDYKTNTIKIITNN